MFQKSDPWDNTYINEEITKIDAKRSQSGRETVIPLDIRERQTFIYAFDPVMTKIEWRRFVFGIVVFSATLSHVMLYFLVDNTVYNLIHGYNQFIDVLINIFSPASLTIGLKGDNFLAKRISKLNNGLDIKKKIVDRLQECKREPLHPDERTYKQILLYLSIIMITIFCSSYGLRFRHYVCSIFYPERVPIRAVWLYNNILSRRGNIFHFFRRQLLRKVYGDHQIEKVSILDRLCAQYREIRILFTLLGLYGKHKYCKICGQKVMIDGSDQSTSCANKCQAYYCYDCVGKQNNVCAVCMNPIDYKLMADMSEEMDSSEDDIAYDRLQYQDFWYQYSESETKSEDINNLLNEQLDVDNYLSAVERKDLVRLAYRYDTVDQVPQTVYLCDDEDYDAEDESEDYEQYLFGLEQELGIPAEQLEEMKRTAQELVAQDINQNVINEAKIEKYSEFRREDDRRLVRNALYLTNRDKKKYIKKSKTKFN